jgi:NAD(P)-dependent dehydrogenase (short-subunit alcohol dehydrogenase family)
VVVTGAPRGLGRAAAASVARAGCALLLTARRAGALEEAARLCGAAGGRAHGAGHQDVTRGNRVQPPGEVARAHGDRPPRLSGGRLAPWVGREISCACRSTRSGGAP